MTRTTKWIGAHFWQDPWWYDFDSIPDIGQERQIRDSHYRRQEFSIFLARSVDGACCPGWLDEVLGRNAALRLNPAGALWRRTLFALPLHDVLRVVPYREQVLGSFENAAYHFLDLTNIMPASVDSLPDFPNLQAVRVHAGCGLVPAPYLIHCINVCPGPGVADSELKTELMAALDIDPNDGLGAVPNPALKADEGGPGLWTFNPEMLEHTAALKRLVVTIHYHSTEDLVTSRLHYRSWMSALIMLNHDPDSPCKPVVARNRIHKRAVPDTRFKLFVRLVYCESQPHYAKVTTSTFEPSGWTGERMPALAALAMLLGLVSSVTCHLVDAGLWDVDWLGEYGARAKMEGKGFTEAFRELVAEFGSRFPENFEERRVGRGLTRQINMAPGRAKEVRSTDCMNEEKAPEGVWDFAFAT